MGQPLGDASAPAFALACREAALYAKVCYSGEGSDEFFAGYNMRRRAADYADRLSGFYIGNTSIMKEDEKKKLLNAYEPDVLPIQVTSDMLREAEGFTPLGKKLSVDMQTWLEGDIYLNVDKMSAAAGLEVRMPLTDMRLFDIAAHIPDRFKVGGGCGKLALRAAAAKVLPYETAFRRKLGFVVPIRRWLADSSYNADVLRRLHSAGAKRFFRPAALDGLWDGYISGNSELWRKIWAIYAFLVWDDEFLETGGRNLCGAGACAVDAGKTERDLL